MRLVFFGSGEFGLPSLQHLAENHDVLAVVSQPDREAGRGKRLTPTPIAAWSREQGIPTLKVESVNRPPIREHIHALDADAFVVIAFGQKLKKKLLADTFAVNLHGSLLPRWRGAAPIHHAILSGDKETGNSVIALADRMDAGIIHAQSRRPLDENYTVGDLHDRLADDGPDLMNQVLEDFQHGTLRPQEQDESLVTLAPRLSKADGWVSFTGTAREALRRIHGLSPWPGVKAFLGETRLSLRRAKVIEDESESSEEACGTLSAEGVVCCRSGSLQLLEIQPAGKRVMSFVEFSRGRQVEKDATLRSTASC